MKLIDRFILIIVAFVLLTISVFGFALTFNVITASALAAFFARLSIDIVDLIGIVTVSVILTVFALKILFVTPKKEKISAYTIHKGEDGDVSVAITAIENTVKLALANFDCVMETKVRITVEQSGIGVIAKIAIPTGVVLPSLLAEIRNYIKSFTEEYTGVPVNQTKLIVTEYKNIDTMNEKKKMAAAKKQEQKKTLAENKNSVSDTHTRIIITREKPEEDVELAKESDVEEIEADETKEDEIKAEEIKQE